jgi:hypothetical protein
MRALALPSRHVAALAARLATVVLAGALLVAAGLPLGPGAALAQSDAALPAVEPVEPYLASDLVPVEIGPRSAVLEIVTTIDLACVVVYGPDDGYGMLALDQQMGAAAHRDHRVVLTGLEPDRDYRFRLQGSAPDGRLFASAAVGFRTPPDDGDDRFGERVDDLRAVAASSEFSAAFAASNAVDRDGGSEWSSRGDGDDAWIEIALPGPTELSGVGVWTRTMATSARIERFEIETDGGATFGPFELPDANGLHRFALDATAERLILRVVDSTGGNTGLVELEAYRAR